MSKLFVQVETQLSEFGFRPLMVASEMGFDTVFVTNQPERYAELAGFSQITRMPGSEIIVADTNSYDGVHGAVAALGGAVRGLYTICDYNLPIVAAVCRSLGLPGVSPEAARLARNKHQTREVCARAGVRVPRYVHVTERGDLAAAVRSVGLPCVVKPMTESASVDVRLCRTRPEAEAHFSHIAANRLDSRGQARPPGALVEEYVLGYEVSVESVTVGGAVHVAGVTDKALAGFPYFVEVGDTFPSLLPERVTAGCQIAAEQALSAIGHDFGAAHTELRLTADGPVLIEVNSRVGGDEITELVYRATGVDLLAQAVTSALGEEPDYAVRRAVTGAASRYLVSQETGTVREVIGADLAARVAGVTEVEIKVGPGDTVTPPRSNHQILGHVVAVGASAAEAARRADAALAHIWLDIRGPEDGKRAAQR
jgi:biotin carboxylase